MVEPSNRTESIIIEDPRGKRATLRLAPGMSIAFIGLDGTGKSTATEMLEKALAEAGLPTTCFHWYSATQTCFRVPVQVLRNRASRRSVQIFDRSIFDNFAVWSQRVGNVSLRNGLLRSAAWLAHRLYPRFDAIVHLTAAPEVIAQRRPEMTPRQITLGREVYAILSEVLKTEPMDTVSIKRVAV